MSEFDFYSIDDFLTGYQKKKFSVAEVLNSVRVSIQTKDKKLNSFVGLYENDFAAHAPVPKTEQPQLAGVPFGVKDVFSLNGELTTASSKILSNYKASYTSTVIERAMLSGGVPVGRNNCDEFAMGSTNENSYLGPVSNPWKLSHVAGGSSGGSAAAVSAGLVPFSFGTDTGGSVRLPAAFCGCVGFKPTYGRMSRYGIIAFASSLDQAGVISRSVKDARKVYEVSSGYDERDSTSVNLKSESAIGPKKKYTVGVPKNFIDKLDGEIKKSTQKALELLANSGYEIKEIELPNSEYAVEVYYIICTSEASSNLSRYDGVRLGVRSPKAQSIKDLYENTRSEGFGLEVQRRIILGTFSLSSGYYDAYYEKACRARRLIQEDFDKAFDDCDVIVGPVTSSTAFEKGESLKDPLKTYYNDIFTIPASLAGLPALSLPTELSSEGLPMSLQVIGKPFEESGLLDFSSELEALLDYKYEVPSELR